MKKMIDFKNWVIIKFISEDWEDLTTIGKIFIFPMWVIRSILIWTMVPFIVIYYIFINSKLYIRLETKVSEIFVDIMHNQDIFKQDMRKD